jgi:hypothetical protein
MATKRMQLAAGAIAVALVAPVRADDEPRRSTGIEDPARVGRPGERTTPQGGGAIAGERELGGTVVKADSKTLYLEHMGAVFPLKIDDETEFSGAGVSSSRDLKEGLEVRASFTVEQKTTNLARRISVAGASGRSSRSTGSTGTTPGEDERIPPGSPPLPPERGPGIPPDRPPMPGDPSGTPAPSDPGAPPTPNY